MRSSWDEEPGPAPRVYIDHTMSPRRRSLALRASAAGDTAGMPRESWSSRTTPKRAGYLRQARREEGYAVDVVHTDAEGSLLAKTEPYDVVVLDVLLPGKNGFHQSKSCRSSRCRARSSLNRDGGI